MTTKTEQYTELLAKAQGYDSVDMLLTAKEYRDKAQDIYFDLTMEAIGR